MPPYQAARPRSATGEEQLHALLRFCYADEWVTEVDFALDMLPIADRCPWRWEERRGWMHVCCRWLRKTNVAKRPQQLAPPVGV